MKQRVLVALLFLFVLVALTLSLHSLAHTAIYTSQSYAITRIALFGVCLVLLVLSWPRWYSARVSVFLFTVFFAELLMYFRRVPVDAAGIGEPVHWFFPFWLAVNALNIFLIPIAVALFIYAYLNEEKTSYVIVAAVYLMLMATLFPFEQICRWGTYGLM